MRRTRPDTTCGRNRPARIRGARAGLYRGIAALHKITERLRCSAANHNLQTAHPGTAWPKPRFSAVKATPGGYDETHLCCCACGVCAADRAFGRADRKIYHAREA